MSNTTIRAALMLVAAAVMYGAIFSCNKIAAEHGIPPTGYSFWQSLGAGAILWVAGALRGTPPSWKWAYLRAYLVVGAVGISLPTALLTYASPHLPAGIITMVLALSPPVTYLVSMLVGLERLKILGILGILFGLVGVGLLVGPTAILPSREMAGWFALALAGPAMFACSNVAVALLRPPAASSVAMGSGIMLGSAVVIIPFVFLTGEAYLPGFDVGGEMLAITVLIYAVFVIIFLEVIRMAGATFFAQFNYIAVLAGIAWGAVLFGEVLGLGVWIALALMAFGIVLTSLKDRVSVRR